MMFVRRSTIRHLQSGCPIAHNGLRGSRVQCPTRFYSSSSSHVPRIASASLWSSMVPKFLRRSEHDRSSEGMGFMNKEWNPATFFIVILLLIGSNSIQLVSIKRHHLNYKRDTEAKLALLREVIDRVQKGEDIDVEAMLGTGDPTKEKEWEEMMKDLERDEDMWAKKQAKRDALASREADPKSEDVQKITATDPPFENEKFETSTGDRKPGFY